MSSMDGNDIPMGPLDRADWDIEANQPARSGGCCNGGCFSCSVVTSVVGTIGAVASVAMTVIGGYYLFTSAPACVMAQATCSVLGVGGGGAMFGGGLMGCLCNGGVTYALRKVDLSRTADVLDDRAGEMKEELDELQAAASATNTAADKQLAANKESEAHILRLETEIDDLHRQVVALESELKGSTARSEILVGELEKQRKYIVQATSILGRAEAKLGKIKGASDDLGKESKKLEDVSGRIADEVDEHRGLVDAQRQETKELQALLERIESLVDAKTEADEENESLHHKVAELERAVEEYRDLIEKDKAALKETERALEERERREEKLSKLISSLEAKIEELSSK